MNLKVRRYYIDTEYINGVKDENGQRVIRPLTEEEKDWLNKFYGEYVCASVPKGEKNLHNTDELRKDCYAKNNARNRCLMNQTQKTGKLVYLTPKEYDKKIENGDWDIFEDYIINDDDLDLVRYEDTEDIDENI